MPAPAENTSILSGKAYEYVVSFRHRFLTYFALPLYLAFLALALTVSHFVRVPTIHEYPVMIEVRQNDSDLKLRFQEDAQSTFGQANRGEPQAELMIIGPDQQMSVKGRINAEGLFHSQHALTKPELEMLETQDYRLTLRVYTREARFLQKLIEEVLTNIQIKKPESSGSGS